MFTINIEETRIVLTYYSVPSNNWIQEKFEKNESINVSKIFRLQKNDVLNYDNVDWESNEIDFIVGKLQNSYWTFDNRIFGIKNSIKIAQGMSISEDIFRSETGRSIFREIDKIITKNLSVGDTDKDDINIDEFNELLKAFPTRTEVDHYISSRIANGLLEYFDDTINFTEKLQKYRINRANKQVIKPKGNIVTVSESISQIFKEEDHKKYSFGLELLESMLNEPSVYKEDDWQKAIVNILLLIFPKYLFVFEKVQVKDVYTNGNRFIDFILVDSIGNIDIIEIKQPFNECMLTKKKYRKNYLPNHELTGAVMQVEKYIYYLNKWGKSGEDFLSQKYQGALGNDFSIKITNPKGIIILGRTNNLDSDQLSDLEIIKRKYANIVDIISYDDLITRLKRLIKKNSV